MTRLLPLVRRSVCSLVLAGCDNKPAANASPQLPAVTVSRPIEQRITEWDEYTGRFVAVKTVEVRARVSGFIDSIHFKDGQIVKQGDLLFIIDARPYRLAVEQAKADLERARSKLRHRHARSRSRDAAAAQPDGHRAGVRYAASDATGGGRRGFGAPKRC